MPNQELYSGPGNGGGRALRTPSPFLAGETSVMECPDNFVAIRYDGPVGRHFVHSPLRKVTNYGLHSFGDAFCVHADDQRTIPNIFRLAAPEDPEPEPAPEPEPEPAPVLALAGPGGEGSAAGAVALSELPAPEPVSAPAPTPALKPAVKPAAKSAAPAKKPAPKKKPAHR